MTLIVGIKCQEGIVLGADSITTFGSAIEQEVDDKIQIIKKDVLTASAGVVGLSQLIAGKLCNQWETVTGSDGICNTRNRISELIWSEISPALQRAAEAERMLGDDLAESVACNFMIAFPMGDSHRLLVFDECAQSLEITFSSPFFTIGSGSFQADPFLAFVKRIFWSDSAPKTLAAGIFCVLWTLDHVSRVNAGLGVGGRPNVHVLKKTDSIWQALRISDYHLVEHQMAILEAEDMLRSFRSPLNLGIDDKDS